jgi:hypothetical protein
MTNNYISNSISQNAGAATNAVNPANLPVPTPQSEEKKKYRMAVKYSAQPIFIPPPFRTNFNPLGSAVPQVSMTFKPEYELN